MEPGGDFGDVFGCVSLYLSEREGKEAPKSKEEKAGDHSVKNKYIFLFFGLEQISFNISVREMCIAGDEKLRVGISGHSFLDLFFFLDIFFYSFTGDEKLDLRVIRTCLQGYTGA